MDALNALNFLRRMRHDFSNHLQVISGYTDLGNPDAVQEYISKVIQEMRQESLILALDNAEISLHLLNQILSVQEFGVLLQYIELDIKSGQRLIKGNEPFNIIKSLIDEKELAGEITLEVSIYEFAGETIVEIEASLLSEDVLTFYLKE